MIAPGISHSTGTNSLPCLDISTPACSARLYLHGAHLTAWQPHGHDPVLFMSKNSHFAPDKPIRGGVPVCFPYFGPDPSNRGLPQHGFARLLPWQLESTSPEIAHDGSVTITLVLHSNPHTHQTFPHDFELRYRITLGHQLIMQLEITNPGKTPFTCSEALHTYFSVGDVAQVAVAGCDQVDYLDKTDSLKQKTQIGVLNITHETDRNFIRTTAPNTLADPLLHRAITIHKHGSNNTVIWNPWSTRITSIPDLDPAEWKNFLCIETVNAAPDELTIAPGTTHTMQAHIVVTKA